MSDKNFSRPERVLVNGGTGLIGSTLCNALIDRGDSVVLAVDDDGPGVPVAERDRIFNRFARIDQARSSSSGGSGLGLAIVSAIAGAHGGNARCVDSPLGGARFEIELPVTGSGAAQPSR